LQEQEDNGQTKYRMKAEQTKVIHTVKWSIIMGNNVSFLIILKTFTIIFGDNCYGELTLLTFQETLMISPFTALGSELSIPAPAR
jgi:hypothetical protein